MNDRVMMVDRPGRGKPLLYFSCSSYGLRTITVPGDLSAKDFKSYIARRLPTLFPARSERRRFDFQRGFDGACTVFACDADVDSELAEGARGRRRSAAIWRLRGSGITDGVRIVAIGDYAEAARIAQGVAVSIQTANLSDGQGLLSAIVPPGAIVELIGDGEADAWLAALEGVGGLDIRRFPLSALSPGPGQTGVFSDEKDRAPIAKAAPYLRVAALGVAALASIGFVESRYEMALERLRDYRSGLASTVIDAGDLARRRDALRVELSAYGTRAPSAVAVLQALASTCSPSFVVDRFSISDGRFEIWAISDDALAELEALEGDERFSGVTLKGIVPGKGGEERFSVAGDYHD